MSWAQDWIVVDTKRPRQDQYGHDGQMHLERWRTIFLPGLDDATSQFASRR